MNQNFTLNYIILYYIKNIVVVDLVIRQTIYGASFPLLQKHKNWDDYFSYCLSMRWCKRSNHLSNWTSHRITRLIFLVRVWLVSIVISVSQYVRSHSVQYELLPLLRSHDLGVLMWTVTHHYGPDLLLSTFLLFQRSVKMNWLYCCPYLHFYRCVTVMCEGFSCKNSQPAGASTPP